MTSRWLLILLLVCAGAPARAELITFGFEGEITEKYETWQFCPTCPFSSRPTTGLVGIPLGSVFSGFYTFDLDFPDSNPDDLDPFGFDNPPGTLGSYDIVGGQLTLNGAVFDLVNLVSDPVWWRSINIANDYIVGDAYAFVAQLAGAPSGNYTPDRMGFQVDYPTDSDGLSTVPPTGFSGSDTRPFYASFLGGRDGPAGDVTVRGRFTAFFLSDRQGAVPLPGTLLLVLLGLALARVARR